MSDDKHHFGSLVKDDFKRFLNQPARLSPISADTHGRWDSTGRQGYLLATRGFQTSGFFQRYPNILAEPGRSYQQFNKYIKLNITLII